MRILEWISGVALLVPGEYYEQICENKCCHREFKVPDNVDINEAFQLECLTIHCWNDKCPSNYPKMRTRELCVKQMEEQFNKELTEIINEDK